MAGRLAYIDECTCYPGRYVPLPEAEELMPDQNKSMKELPLNLDEFDDFFRIEVPVPGTSREDILVSSQDDILSIKVSRKKAGHAGYKSRIHEFDTSSFERHLVLPPEADAGLISAVYKEGMLSLHIPKSQQPAKLQPDRIVVY